jgi:predicted amino acid dehydrogenase
MSPFYFLQKFLSSKRKKEVEIEGSNKRLKKIAFLIHPRISAREDMRRVFPLFQFIPESILQKLLKILPPVARGKITFEDTKEIIGWIIVIPILGKQFLEGKREFIFNKLLKALKIAKKLGVEIIGLGEFIASVTEGGKDLEGKVDGILIDNGKSLTAATIIKFLEEITKMRNIDLTKEKIAIVGAGGSIGLGVSLFLASKKFHLILIEKKKKIPKLINLFSSFPNVEINDNLFLLKKTKIVVVCTSSTEKLIKSKHLKEGAIIYDITQPRNTSPEILRQRKDITIIDGGIFDTPKIDYGMDIGLKKHQAYACLTETIICALEGVNKSYVGYAHPQEIEKMLKLMEKYKNYFKLNISQSFGKSLSKKLKILK